MRDRQLFTGFIASAAAVALLVCAPAVAAAVEEKAQPHVCRIVGPANPAEQAALAMAPADASALGFPGVQLEMRTPFEPTAFPRSGRNYLVYELHLRNFGQHPMTLDRLEISGAEPDGQPLAQYDAGELMSVLDPHGGSRKDAADHAQLGGGEGAVAFLCLAFDRGVEVPLKLRHRFQVAGEIVQGPVVGTRHTELRTLAPPVSGANWIAAGGPGCNLSHHRLGLVVAQGRAAISRRHAVDWKQVREGSFYSGDPLDPRSYHAYGENVLAVADATVVGVNDDLPDNVPRTEAGFTPAVPITLETIGGNHLTLDLGDGQFAYYAHLQPGSVAVKPGQRVRRGQVLGRIGNSGDSREPHLHFHVSTAPDSMAAEGLPYVIDRYHVQLADDTWAERTRELPVMGALVNFGQAATGRD